MSSEAPGVKAPGVMASAAEGLHLPEFHHANIHEGRLEARIARALPLLFLLLIVVMVAFGVFFYTGLLLATCAVLNISIWLFVTTSACFAIMGCNHIEETATASERAYQRLSDEEKREVTHVIVVPNYYEDVDMLGQTLQCIAEATGSERFHVVLAMEAREVNVTKKADELVRDFAPRFARIFAAYHPHDLVQKHLDGSEDAEVAGKASNVKWAVQKAYEHMQSQNLTDGAILTVADADCLLHPQYFAHLTVDYLDMRSFAGEQHKWTMWQPPQLPYRNYYSSPVVSRVWGYISSVYEFGGVCSIRHSGHHMVFSAYSVNLLLAVEANLWDGDIIAEDHHAYLKCFFFSVRKSAMDVLSSASSRGCRPALRVRAVMLPVKSTSVVDPAGYWQTCVARWKQAVRHTQGIAELSYSFLATWDMLCALPWKVYNAHFCLQLLKVVVKPIFMHTVPTGQSIALGILTFYWLLHGRRVPQCPDKIWVASTDSETLLCGLAGAWALTWPVLIPFFLVACANYCFLRSAFLKPHELAEQTPGRIQLWYRENGGVKPTWGSKELTVFRLVAFDCAVWMGPVMLPYGLVAQVIGCWNVFMKGNHFKYETAAKGGTQSGYGTFRDSA